MYNAWLAGGWTHFCVYVTCMQCMCLEADLSWSHLLHDVCSPSQPPQWDCQTVTGVNFCTMNQAFFNHEIYLFFIKVSLKINFYTFWKMLHHCTFSGHSSLWPVWSAARQNISNWKEIKTDLSCPWSHYDQPRFICTNHFKFLIFHQEDKDYNDFLPPVYWLQFSEWLWRGLDCDG